MQFDDPMTPVFSIVAALLTLVGVIVVGRVGRRSAELANEPGVLGELLVGVIVSNLGAQLGFPLAQKMFQWNQTTAAFRSLSYSISPLEASLLTLWLLSNTGLLLLMFHVGLENSFAHLRNVAKPAARVAILGVVVPFALAVSLTKFVNPQATMTMALFLGGTLAATSIAITARALKDANALDLFESRVVLGAAVIDDILGMILLAAISAWAEGQAQITSLVFNGTILLAFLAGAWVSKRASSFKKLAHLEGWLAPVFFVVTGMQVDLSALSAPPTIELALLLTAVAIIGKLLAGLAVKKKRWLVGAAMIPRGEISLVFANFGHATGVFSDAVFTAILVMVLLTSGLTPIFLGRLLLPKQEKL